MNTRDVSKALDLLFPGWRDCPACLAEPSSITDLAQSAARQTAAQQSDVQQSAG